MNRKNNLYLAVFCFLIALFCLCQLVKADKWIATWDANTETDLAGYLLYVANEAGSDSLRIADTDTNYVEFEHDLPFCAFVKAYDEAGNVSKKSEVVCVYAAPQVLGDFNGDKIVNVFDNILFNNSWHLFATTGEYNILYDLYPVNAPDGQINMFDKLQFHNYWRP